MKNIISIQYARKRKKVTDYRKRLKLIMSGKERLVIRKTSKQIIVQLVRFSDKGDNVLVTVPSTKLKKYGWKLGTKNIAAAYLTGLMAGKLALSKKVSEAVLDTGMSKPESRGRIYAALKGVVDAGMQVPSQESIFPVDDRLSGKHLQKDDAQKIFQETKANIVGDKSE